MNILFDTNVQLDVLLKRQPNYTAAVALSRASIRGQITGYMATFALTTVFYTCQRQYRAKFDNKQAAKYALDDVLSCLDQFKICSVSRQTLESATKMPGQDFEDNLQIACALAEGLDAIVTSNIKDFRGAGITLYTPAQLVKKLKLR